MKKVVILGCENSHADTFLNYIKNYPEYSDIETIGVYSEDEGGAEKLNEKYGVKIMKSYDEAVGKVDGVIITARRGKDHYRFAKPYIPTGVPMFIDKPITYDEDEAIKLANECRTAGVRLTGGSSCIHVDAVKELKKEREENVGGKTLGGYVRCPISLKNNFGGFYFYCEHLIGITANIFGFYPKSVKTFTNAEKITVVFRYADYDVVGLFVDGDYVYYASRVFAEGVHGEVFPIAVDSPCFKTEFNEIHDILNGGKQRISYEDFIAPVFIMNAVKKSMECGEEVTVNQFKL